MLCGITVPTPPMRCLGVPGAAVVCGGGGRTREVGMWQGQTSPPPAATWGERDVGKPVQQGCNLELIKAQMRKEVEKEVRLQVSGGEGPVPAAWPGPTAVGDVGVCSVVSP